MIPVHPKFFKITNAKIATFAKRTNSALLPKSSLITFMASFFHAQIL